MADTGSPSGASTSTGKSSRKYTVVPFPKIVFFYPLMLVSVICGLLEIWKQEGVNSAAGPTFVIVFLINILVISFDFPGVKALALTFGTFAFVLGVLYLDSATEMNILDFIMTFLKQIFNNVTASPMMYFMVAAILFIMIGGGILANVFWNRWTIEPNRLRHKHGIMSNVKQYPVIDLQLQKEIEDVFEYALLLSGTLTFQPNPDTPPIRLENIPFINRAEDKILHIIRELKVSS